MEVSRRSSDAVAQEPPSITVFEDQEIGSEDGNKRSKKKKSTTPKRRKSSERKLSGSGQPLGVLSPNTTKANRKEQLKLFKEQKKGKEWGPRKKQRYKPAN